MPEQNALLVRARRLHRYYSSGQGRIAALSAVSFDIHANDHIALIGPSGSGKSTLLGLAAGLDHSEDGTIEWPTLAMDSKGRPRGIAFAFQAPSLIPSLTLYENCLLPLVLAGEEARSDEIHTALDLFGIVNLADRLPEQVSGGQAQRAALARAVVTRPRLLIADEPTGQLDQVTRLRVIEALMIWGRAAGCALLIASHDLEIAARVGTIWTIEHGKLTCPPRGSDARSTPDWGSAA